MRTRIEGAVEGEGKVTDTVEGEDEVKVAIVDTVAVANAGKDNKHP